MIWRGVFLLFTLIALGLAASIAFARTFDTSPIWTVHRIDADGNVHAQATELHLLPSGQYRWSHVSVRSSYYWVGLSAGWTVYAAVLFRQAWIRRLHAP